MDYNSKIYKLFGLKFGIESEGFLTTDNSGYKTAYAEDWLNHHDLLGCDGRSDTVELRSDPIDNLHELEFNITNTLKYYSECIPEDMNLIFAPYAEATTQSKMPCGLHITFTINKEEFHEGLSVLYDNGRFIKFIESKFPLNGVVSIIEGNLGKERRECSNYGGYRYGSLYTKQFKQEDTYNKYDFGYEYRVFSSCLSNKDLFFKLVNDYMFLTFIYLYNYFYNNIPSFKSNSNIFRRDLTKAILDLKKDIVNKNIFDMYEILKNRKYKVILDWWENDDDSVGHSYSILDSLNSKNLIDGMDKSKVLIDVYKAWEINKDYSNTSSYCEECLRKYCECDGNGNCPDCGYHYCRCDYYCGECDRYDCICDQYCNICGEYTNGSCDCCHECDCEICCCHEEEVEV